MEIIDKDSCRGCLRQLEPTGQYSFMCEEIKDLFTDCTGIKISSDGRNDLPQQLCFHCYSKCSQWSSFRTICLEVNAKLLATPSSTPPLTMEIKKEINEEVPEEEYEDTFDLASCTFGELIKDPSEPNAEQPVVLLERLSEDSISQLMQSNTQESCDSEEEHESYLLSEVKVEEDETPSEYSNPLDSDDNNNRAVKCPVCFKAFSYIWKLRNHFVIHTKERPFQCMHCDLDFRNKQGALRHIRNFHKNQPIGKGIQLKKGSIFENENPWECSLPEEEPIEVEGFIKVACLAKRSAGNKLYRCPHCAKRFSADHLLQHTVVYTDETPFQCNQCEMMFRNRSLIDNHIKLKHSPSNKGFSIVANSLYARMTALNTKYNRVELFVPKPDKYVDQVSNEKRRQTCNQCQEKYWTIDELKEHIETRHPFRESHPFECTVCGNSFKRKKHLVSHKRCHSQVKEFGCTFCGKTFKGSSGRRKHIRNHHPKQRPNEKESNLRRVDHTKCDSGLSADEDENSFDSGARQSSRKRKRST